MADLDLSRHSLNMSQSKQKYSFPRTKRFLDSDKALCDSLYGLPSTSSKRATSLGLGNKTLGIQNNMFIPGVGSYNLKNEINPQENKHRSISFGVSREHMDQGGPLGSLKFLKEYPAPGIYAAKDVHDRRGPTLRSRHPDHDFQKFARNPGPGTYNHENMGGKSYYLNSRYKNDTNVKISQVSRLQPINKRSSIGPTDYKPIDTLNGPGRYTLAQHPGVSACVIGRSQRKGIVQTGILKFPGPGQQYVSYDVATPFQGLDEAQ